MRPCPRCGEKLLGPDTVCLACWDGHADGPGVERLARLVAGDGTSAGSATAERAVLALGEVGDQRARQALLACLDHPAPLVRLAAARSLGWSGTTADIARLAACADDPDAPLGLRAEAAGSIAEIAGATATDAGATLDSLSRHGIAWLDPLTPAPMPTLAPAPFSTTGPAGHRPDGRPAAGAVPTSFGAPRTVPKYVMVDATAGGIVRPPIRFGGQPTWREAPWWPLGPDEQPLRFYGQFDLPDGRTAYLFLDPDGDSYAPLGPANALVVQPGGRCHLGVSAEATGPTFYRRAPEPARFRPRSRAVPLHHDVALVPAADPVAWGPEADTAGHEAWNKVGGTPLFLQGDEWPPGPGWTFAFQFSAGWAGHELGDGAECYAFLHPDGSAAFLWQCS